MSELKFVTEGPVVAVAEFCFVCQAVSMYQITGVLKYGESWEQGVAVWETMQIPHAKDNMIRYFL